MRLLFNIVFIVFSIPLVVFAKKPLTAMPPRASYCLSNLAEYNEHKAKLPAFLQTIPVWLGADKKVFLVYHVIAALRISFRGSTMMISSDIWNPKDKARYTDTAEIKRACFYNGNRKMVVESVNGAFTESSYTANSLNVQGVALAPVSPGFHQTLIDRVKAENGNRPGRPSPSAGVTQ